MLYGNIIAVCPSKAIEFDGDTPKRVSSESALHSIMTGVGGNYTRYCFDGGAFAITGDVDIHTQDHMKVAFTGSMAVDNVRYLVKYLWAQHGIEVSNNPAEVIAHLYRREGTGFLPRVRGSFAAVVYNTVTQKMLAVRDISGQVRLYQGQDIDGGLLVSTQPIADNMEEIPAGHYIAGRYRDRAPVQFARTESDKATDRQAAQMAAQRALAGILSGVQIPSAHVATRPPLAIKTRSAVAEPVRLNKASSPWVPRWKQAQAQEGPRAVSPTSALVGRAVELMQDIAELSPMKKLTTAEMAMLNPFAVSRPESTDDVVSQGRPSMECGRASLDLARTSMDCKRPSLDLVRW